MYDWWTFIHCDGLTFESQSKTGVIDGQGYMWWIRELFGLNGAGRPKLIAIIESRNIEMSGLFITNSPSFHVKPYLCENVYLHDFEIFVDVWGQLELSKLFSSKLNLHKGIELPMFPLNTDGIDISGRNFTLRRIKITNWDDAIVVKPLNSQ